ncbi:MAG: hypothetical protein IJQ90_04455 [Alphaproteobacteria bacterium]|nr:hypothetical protein [Alphaproteobacteria bacterium]
MANTENNVKKYNIGTYIGDAIAEVIGLAKVDNKNYILIYNNWFKMTVTPTTTLDYGLRLFFNKSMSHPNLGMGQIKSK